MQQYFGSKVSLCTNNDTLYEGILHAIHNETISLKEVYHMTSDGIISRPTAASFQLFKVCDINQLYVHENNGEKYNLTNELLIAYYNYPQKQTQKQNNLNEISLNPLPDLDEQHEQLNITFSNDTFEDFNIDDAIELEQDDINDINEIKWRLDDIDDVVVVELEQDEINNNNNNNNNKQLPDFTQLINEDMGKINKSLGSVQLPSDILYQYKTQLEKLKETKIQYEAWLKSQQQQQQQQQQQKQQQQIIDIDDPFNGLDDIIDPFNGLKDIIEEEEESKESKDIRSEIEPYFEPYFGFNVNNNIILDDYRVLSDEILINLSGYKFTGGSKLSIIEKDSETIIGHIGKYSGNNDYSGRDIRQIEKLQEWNSCYSSFFIRSSHKNKIEIGINKLDIGNNGNYGICIGIIDSERDFSNTFHYNDRECYGYRSDGIQYVNGKLVGKWDEYYTNDKIILLICNNTIKWLVNNVIKCIQYNIIPSRKYRLCISICGMNNSVSILNVSKIENAQSVLKKKKKK